LKFATVIGLMLTFGLLVGSMWQLEIADLHLIWYWTKIMPDSTYWFPFMLFSACREQIWIVRDFWIGMILICALVISCLSYRLKESDRLKGKPKKKVVLRAKPKKAKPKVVLKSEPKKASKKVGFLKIDDKIEPSA